MQNISRLRHKKHVMRHRRDVFDIKSKPYKQSIVEVDTVLKIVPNQNVKHKIYNYDFQRGLSAKTKPKR